MKERYFYLDAMRGILMTLGVVLHSAQVFNPRKEWLVYSDDSLALSAWLVDIIHAFRMPAFFVVSGFFCMMTLRRYGRKLFLRKRLIRIAVPLLATALLLNTIQTVLLNDTGWTDVSLADFLLEGGWVLHLWFLNYLVLYFVIAVGLSVLLDWTAVGKLNEFEIKKPRTILFVLLAAAPLYTIGLSAESKFGISLYQNLGGVIQLYQFLFYLQFFVVGLWLQSRPNLMQSLNETSILLCVAVVASTAWISVTSNTESSLAMIVISTYSRMLMTWFSVVLCFALFFRFANKSIPWLRNLSEASYSIYLVHQIFVVCLGLLIVRFRAEPAIALPLLILVVFVISYAVHSRIISRYALPGFLFNGKMPGESGQSPIKQVSL